MSRVLVVDDDEAIRASARCLLEDIGYGVQEADDGAAALDLLRASDEPLVVLLDIGMPRLGGVDVLVLLASGDSRLARHSFIVWTANRTVLPAGLLAALGVPLVDKPFDLNALFAAVANAAARLAPSPREIDPASA